MNIRQAAQQSGLSSKQIRDYEKLGLLPISVRSEANYRQYRPQDIQRMRFIRHAREVGFSLLQIGELLRLQDNPQRSSRAVKQLTAEHIAELDNKIKQLQEMRDQLQIWHNQCAGDEQAQCCILDGLAQSSF